MPRLSKDMLPITNGPGHVFARQIKNIRVKARERRQVLIGSSASPNPPKGFSVMVRPFSMVQDAITTRITTSGGNRHYDYILEIDNGANRTISAEVWQM
jgi:hypothetical protein